MKTALLALMQDMTQLLPEADYRVVVIDAINRAVVKYRNENGGLAPGRLLLAPAAYKLVTDGADPLWHGIPVEVAETHTGQICYAVSAPRRRFTADGREEGVVWP